MAASSAGIVLWRRVASEIEILLVHPGGPFWRGKNEHAWSIPKGEFDVSSIRLEDTVRSVVELEWPPRSGKIQRFPEVDEAAWVRVERAVEKLHKGLAPIAELVIKQL